MAGIRVIATLLAFAAAASAEGVSPSEYGMIQTNQALTSVCWYENLKVFPKTNTKQYNKCSSAEKIMNMLKEQGHTGAMLEGGYGNSMDNILNGLPSEYKSNCKAHLDSKAAATSDNESDALNDQGFEYPFRAFAYCLIKTLRGKHGEKAIAAIKEERTHTIEPFLNAIHKRQNEFRELHGVKQLDMIQELNDAAQRWSEKSAAACDDVHIKEGHPDYIFHGKAVGENLYSGGGLDDGNANGYRAIDSWYQEIASYPFPQGVDNSAGGIGGGVIGHFTQSVWAGSQYVGYGYAHNPKCQPYQTFITARYWPAGNMGGAFRDNVKPPQH